ALGRQRRFVFEPRPHRRVLAVVVPQCRFDATAQVSLRRPARVGGDERPVAFDTDVVVVAAHDQPFGERFRYRIRDRVFERRGIGRGFGNGTFGLAETSDARESPIAKARPVASAVDRNAAAWTDLVTGFPADESFDLTSAMSI